MAEAIALGSPANCTGMTPSRRATTEAEAIAWLVDQVPELGPLLDEHLADNHDELLPYVAFAVPRRE